MLHCCSAASLNTVICTYGDLPKCKTNAKIEANNYNQSLKLHKLDVNLCILASALSANCNFSISFTLRQALKSWKTFGKKLNLKCIKGRIMYKWIAAESEF